jgi:hypothetical protein
MCKLKGPMRGVKEDNAFRNVEWESTLPNGVVTDLINKRKPGYDKCSVFESSIPNAGLGLFATRNIPAKDKICSYEGPQVSQERVDEGYGKTNDYLAEVVTDRSTGEMIIIDGEGMSHFGRFANDPLDDLAVNAKIVWVGNKAMLVATTDIVAGDEILISYGTGYWKERVERIIDIPEDKRKRIRSGKTVVFDAVKTLVPYPWTSSGLPLVAVTPLFKTLEKERQKRRRNNKGQDLTKSLLMSNDLVETVPLGTPTFKPASPLEEYVDTLAQEALEDDSLALEDILEDEDLAFELQYLVGRRYEDEGKLHQVTSVIYSEQFERLVAFRRTLTKKGRD